MAKKAKSERTTAPAAEGHLLALALRNAYWAMHRRTNALLKPHGVTADQFVLLKHLAEAGSITQHELARRASSDANTVRPMLALLEKAGSIARSNHPTDRRARIIVLTPAGKKRLQAMLAATEPCRRTILSGIGKKNAAAVQAALAALTAALSAS